MAHFPYWLRDIIKTTPERVKGGKQFDPRDVPVLPVDPAGNRAFDPRFSREDLHLMAAKGTADVLSLAGGSDEIPGFTSFWPGGGRWEGPSRVAAGENILGGQPWQYYDIGNPEAPWIGLEGPRGSLGEWRKIPGESRMGRVIDVKQQGYGGYGVLRRGQYDRRGNLIGGSAGGGGGGDTPRSDFGYWGSSSFGGGMPGWFSPGIAGGGAPTGASGGGGPVTGQGQVFAGGSNIGYAPGTYTGEIGAPGDPLNAGGDFGGREPMYGGYGTTPGTGIGVSGPTQIPTDWVNYPGLGMVPRAVALGGPQASTNLLDYLNPFGGTSKGGSNTGGPTQRGIGMAVGTASNFLFPGLGFVTGPLARWVTAMIQGGATKQQIQEAVAQGKTPKMPSGSVSLPTTPPPTAPSGGFSPTGQTPYGREWWSSDFGRGNAPLSDIEHGGTVDRGGGWTGDYNLAGPGGGFGQRGTGFGSGTVGNLATAIGFESLGRGGGQANFGNAWGGGPAAQQLRHIYKGIYGNDPNPEGMGALYSLTGTKSPSAGAYQQSQSQLHDILQANPSLMSGYSSGPMARGGSRIPLQTT